MARDTDNEDSGYSAGEDELWQACLAALEPYKAVYGEDFVAEVRDILRRNYCAKRIARWLGRQPHSSVADYVRRVVENYRQEKGLYWLLFIEGDLEAWQKLSVRLANIACKFLCCRGLLYFIAAEVALDYSQSAIEVILRGRFPFDTTFDAWTTVILQNLIRKGARSSRVNGDAVPLDDVGDEWIPDLTVRDLDYEMRIEQVRWAISQLRPDYAEFINLHYMDGLSYEEIVTRLGCEVTVLYDRNKNAKKQLRQILGSNGII